MADGYIEPGNPQGSHLLDLISSTNGKAAMPKGADPLSAEEVRLVQDWIAGGAKWPNGLRLEVAQVDDLDWWSLRPLSSVALPDSDQKIVAKSDRCFHSSEASRVRPERIAAGGSSNIDSTGGIRSDGAASDDRGSGSILC